MTSMKSIRRWAGMLAATALAAACAAPADVKPMIASGGATPPADPALVRAVCVELVKGGKKTNPLWVSEVDNQSFLKALEASLDNAGLLAKAPDVCRYGVEAHLLGLSQPFVGLDVEVTANVNYRVRAAGVAEPYLLKTQQSTYVTKFTGDKILWASRLKQANEGAARRNIEGFIEALQTRR